MTDLDQKILTALKESDAELKRYEQELGIFGLIGESFKGRFRGIVAIAFVFILVFLGLTIYCAIELVQATELGPKINWLAATFGSFMAVAFLRLWYFMELNRISLQREIKRVELLLAAMAKKVV